MPIKYTDKPPKQGIPANENIKLGPPLDVGKYGKVLKDSQKGNGKKTKVAAKGNKKNA